MRKEISRKGVLVFMALNITLCLVFMFALYYYPERNNAMSGFACLIMAFNAGKYYERQKGM